MYKYDTHAFFSFVKRGKTHLFTIRSTRFCEPLLGVGPHGGNGRHHVRPLDGPGLTDHHAPRNLLELDLPHREQANRRAFSTPR